MQSISEQLEQITRIKRVFDYVADGNLEAGNILIYIKSTYKQWGQMILWLKANDIRGQKLVDFFKNESDSTGGGYLLGCTLIINRINKTNESLKITDLI